MLNYCPLGRVTYTARQMDVHVGARKSCLFSSFFKSPSTPPLINLSAILGHRKLFFERSTQQIVAVRFPLAMMLPGRKNFTSPHHAHRPSGQVLSSLKVHMFNPLSPVPPTRMTRSQLPPLSMTFIDTTFTNPSPRPRIRMTHPQPLPHPLWRRMRDVPVDGLLMLLPGGPSPGNFDAIIDGDEKHPHTTELEVSDTGSSSFEAEELRTATLSPELYLCDGWCKIRGRRDEENATVVSLYQWSCWRCTHR